MKTSVVPWGPFPEASVEEAIERAAAAGVDGIEILDTGEHSPAEVGDLAAEHGIEIAVLAATGETPGIDEASPAIVDPDSVEESIADLERSIEAAEAAGAHNLLVTVGQGRDDLAPHEHHVTLVEVLRAIAPAADDAGVTVVPEVLNARVDHPGYYLTSSYEGYEIVHGVDSPAVRLLYDIYHQQITEGNVIQNLRENVEFVGHVHAADVPGRHEPGTGEIAYERVFAALDDAGYDGFVGAEFAPTGDGDDAVAEFVDLVP